MVVPNDNRTAAGTLVEGTLELALTATIARWLPDSAADSTVTVQAFAEGEGDGVPRIPGPLLRAVSGSRIRIRVANAIGATTLVVHGLLGAVGTDSVVVPSGEERVVDFIAGAPGTYLYWGTTSGKSFADRSGRDAQLTGAIVIDDPAVPVDPDERILVLTTLDLLPDTSRRPPQLDDIFDQAINGLSWPYTERLRAVVGDTVRWRLVNGSYLSHPMHLHGFHFRVLAKGNGRSDTLYAPGTEPSVVTELMRRASTLRLEFTPIRAGNWLFHCHMAAHVVPFPERPDSVRAHDLHDGAAHVSRAMSGLVMGLEVAPRSGSAEAPVPPIARRHRIFAQEVRGDSGRLARRGFVLERGVPPRRDSIEIPGSPLILTRGERVEITVLNRLSQATAVHWHGMELDPYFDGVAGWSGSGTRVSPMIAPGDSFTVSFTPPRAGTFIYHSHLEEEPQLHFGMFGAMLVLEPGETYRPDTDRTFVIGDVSAPRAQSATLNGRVRQDTLTLRAGAAYRFRFINILAVVPQDVLFSRDTVPLRWTPIAKDGADLPPTRRVEREARFTFGVGETYDFAWTAPRGPAGAAPLTLLITPSGPETDTLRLPIRIRP